MTDLVYQSPSDELVATRVSPLRPWRHHAQGAAVASIVLLLVGAAVHGVTNQANVSAIEDTESLAEVDTAQPNFQAVVKENDHCATLKEDCAAAKCCQTTGYKCIKSGKETQAKCLKTCAEGKQCTVLSEEMTFDVEERRLMFCYSVYTANTGSTKTSYELDTLKFALRKVTSIFQCDNKGVVYGDEEVVIGTHPETNEEVKVNKVTDVKGDFHFAKRKHMGTWINTGMYKQIWKAIAADGEYVDYHWVVKADADAVFFPQKLVNRIYLLPVPPPGAFLINCESVKYGFFGNLEVISKTAFSILTANIDTCDTDTVADWKVGIEHGKHGPMGEDLFAEMCMRKNGITGLEVFDISKDGCCPAKRPGNEKSNKKWKPDCSTSNTAALHPFKKPAEYAACYEAAKEVV